MLGSPLTFHIHQTLDRRRRLQTIHSFNILISYARDEEGKKEEENVVVSEIQEVKHFQFQPRERKMKKSKKEEKGKVEQKVEAGDVAIFAWEAAGDPKD